MCKYISISEAKDRKLTKVPMMDYVTLAFNAVGRWVQKMLFNSSEYGQEKTYLRQHHMYDKRQMTG